MTNDDNPFEATRADISEWEEVSYPPEPSDDLQIVLLEGMKLRHRGDALKWWHGWRYEQIKTKWPNITYSQYADRVGYAPATFLHMWRAARVFKPEHVNAFPGIPFSMWSAVSSIGETDIEEALSLIENAYDSPDITVSQFLALVRGEEQGGALFPPLSFVGRLAPKLSKRDGKSLLTLEIDPDFAVAWEDELQKSQYGGKQVKVTITFPKNVAV